MNLSNRPISDLLSDLSAVPLHEKAERSQGIYDRVAFSPSGMMYSMQRFADGEIRPFRPSDFDGAIFINPSVGKLDIDGPWDYLHGENSITASGIYLAAQAYRIQVEDTPAAREQAERAFHSLELIFEMGVNAGKPGWMNKPYGFRPSNQTSPDQYNDACWGLFTYHKVAPPARQRRIEEMIVAFADYWRGVDYTLTYFGKAWNLREETGYGNATTLLIQTLANRFTGDPAYLRDAEWFRDHQTWMRSSTALNWLERIETRLRETGQLEAFGSATFPWITPLLEPGEALFWESAILCKFVAVASEILHEVQPDLLDGHLPTIMEQWWQQGQYSIGEDVLPYYWIAADFRHGTWRPLPATEPVPREQWPFGDPFFANVSQIRWFEPLARSMVTSVIAHRHAPAIADAALRQARHLLEAVDATRLLWLFDPDGKQLLPEITYYGHCLSSEMPASFLATYWRGRLDGLW